jgi:ferredoxin
VEKVMRKIIMIDEEKCDGCGLCIPSCAEGALQIVEGKARLVNDVYCDGLGNCLGECPQGAIGIIEREAVPFDENAVEEHLSKLDTESGNIESESECSTCCGSAVKMEIKPHDQQINETRGAREVIAEPEAELSHWPVQLHLVSPESKFLKGADLLIAADCVPFAYADFHQKYLAGKELIIGCPKLDDVGAYHQKLVQIFKHNNLKSIALIHMEVGCCYGISKLVRSALDEAGVTTPLQEIVISVDGKVK